MLDQLRGQLFCISLNRLLQSFFLNFVSFFSYSVLLAYQTISLHLPSQNAISDLTIILETHHMRPCLQCCDCNECNTIEVNLLHFSFKTEISMTKKKIIMMKTN